VRIAIALPAALAFHAAASTGHSQPSFDCDRSLNPTERRICDIDRLSSLDRDLAALYRGLTGRGDARLQAAMAIWQKSWIGQRDRCGTDVACIDRQYQGRIAELRAVEAVAADSSRRQAQHRMRVLANGTLEVRGPGGRIVTLQPGRTARSPAGGGQRFHARDRSASGIRQTMRDWSGEFGPILLTIIKNLLPDDSVESYLRAEREEGVTGNDLVAYRLRWLVALTGQEP
jgi:uncharacterized protein YecT (DUF1311 family)